MDRPRTLPLTDNIMPLPGKGCLFYCQGYCLYEEILNPGLYPARQCILLRELEDAFESFVDRAERFRLDDQSAGRIWDHLAQGLYSTMSCKNYCLASDRDDGQCVYLYDNACIRMFPHCSGRCFRFTFRNRDDAFTLHPFV